MKYYNFPLRYSFKLSFIMFINFTFSGGKYLESPLFVRTFLDIILLNIFLRHQRNFHLEKKFFQTSYGNKSK